MRLSRTVHYALQATLILAQQDSLKPVPCSQLAREGDMPERFLLQILRNLVNQGLLRSTRGVEGGYALAQPPEEVSVLDVIEALEGPMDASATGEAFGVDGLALKEQDPQARLRAALDDVSQTLKQQLDAIKIAHLLPQPSSSAATAN